MKIKSFIFYVLFFVSFSAYGQMQDLQKLAEGKLVFGSILYDSNDDLYGYFYLFERDKDKVYKTMEYVFLDKNLNKASNNTFKCYSYENKFQQDYLNCTLMGDSIMLSKYIHNDNTPIVNSFQIISLKDKSVSPEYQYSDGVFSELPESGKELKKHNKRSGFMVMVLDLVSAFNEGENKGFLIKQTNASGIGLLDCFIKDLKFYDTNKNLKWTYVYNADGTQESYIRCNILNYKNNNLYLLEEKKVINVPVEHRIVCLDMETGKPKYDYTLESYLSRYSHSVNCKEINGKLEIAGNYAAATKDKLFKWDKNLGFYKIVLDSTGDEIVRKYSRWSDFSETLNIDVNGKIDKDFRLRPTKFFFFADGSISILTEKYKPAKDGVWWIPVPVVNYIVAAATSTKEKSTDFVLFNMGKDFGTNSVNTIKKELSSSGDAGGTYDYLFSQYINNDNDAVFFYKDLIKKDKKDKDSEDHWMLGINTIINGELTEEKIPISAKKKYVIEPLPAKEGYILLREYNVDDKYDQIRLEKLNY